MIALGMVEEDGANSPFPRLEVKDTFMKSTSQRRQLGDSRHTDGMLWSFPAKNILPQAGVPSMGDFERPQESQPGMPPTGFAPSTVSLTSPD